MYGGSSYEQGVLDFVPLSILCTLEKLCFASSTHDLSL